MYCKKCGAELKDTAKFCTSCGAKTDVGVNVENKSPANDVKKQEKSGTGKRIAVILGLLIIVAALILGGYYLTKGDSPDQTEDNAINVVEETPPEPAQSEVTPDDYADFLYTFDGIIEDYYFYDVDDNGVDDVIVLTGDSEAAYLYDIYTIENGEIIEMGAITGGHSVIYGNANQPGLLRMQAHMGYEQIYEVTYQNGILSENIIFDKEIPPEEDYYVPEGAIELESEVDDYY